MESGSLCNIYSHFMKYVYNINSMQIDGLMQDCSSSISNVME